MSPGARYLVRFDDICPTMNWGSWERIEAALVELGIKPILAVIPDNRDEALFHSPPRADFWDRARHWQSLGWFIAMHGYDHRYVTRHPGLMGINPRSEFSGLPREAQEEKLRNGLSIFGQNGVRVDGWVAPGHSFDAVTVELLRKHGVGVVSDGFFLRPVRFLETLWIPQQLWRFYPMPFGVWTVCHHHSRLSPQQVSALLSTFSRYADRMTSVPELLAQKPPVTAGALDRLFSRGWTMAVRAKRALSP